MKRKIKALSILLAIGMCVPMAACKKSKEFNYMHLSLDDTMFSFQNLAEKEYDSLFDEPFFGALKEVHEEYGAVISLYTYNNVLEEVPDSYAGEFTENADWLKIGLHSKEHYYKFNRESYEQGQTHWNTFVGHVERVCGTRESMDRVPRLEFFEGTKECLLGMKEAENGALGFLTSSDSAKYYYDFHTAEYIKENDHAKDPNTGLVFLPTDLQLEYSQNPYEELTARKGNAEFKKRNASIIVYSHEYYLYNGEETKVILEDKFKLLEDCCKFAKDNNVKFDFPQNRKYKNSKGDLFAE